MRHGPWKSISMAQIHALLGFSLAALLEDYLYPFFLGCHHYSYGILRGYILLDLN